LFALLAPVWLPTAAFAQELSDAPVVVEASDADVDDYRETAARFTSRMREFEEEARDIISNREQDDKAKLRSSYDAILEELGEDERRLRDTAISKFEGFLGRYPDSSESPSVMIRLAELYFENAESEYMLAQSEYDRYYDTLSSDSSFEDLPEEPLRDFGKSIALYQKIIADHPEYRYIDGAYYMLGFCLSDGNASQFDYDAGLGAFTSLVERFPSSAFASSAHLNIGEYYFEENSLDEAIYHYDRAVQLEGIDGSYYDEGLYKLAWSHYKKSNYDTALQMMTELLDFSERQFLNTGKRANTAKEAIEYSAISFSDVADETFQDPIDVASAFYNRVGTKPFESQVYERLADILTQQARYEDAIETYLFMQEEFPVAPENPTYQWKVAQLYGNLAVPDEEAVQQTIADLNDRYNDKSEWWRENQNNPDALSVARGYIEQSLSTIAQVQHQRAGQSGNPQDYVAAAALYKQYLDEFPFADNYHQIQWLLADTMIASGQFESVVGQLGQLVKTGPDHNYGEVALYRLMIVRQQMIVDTYGDDVSMPEGTPVLERRTLDSGNEREVFVISDDHQSFIGSFDEVMDADFAGLVTRLETRATEVENEKLAKQLSYDLITAQSYLGAIIDNEPIFTYNIGKLLYNHGHLEDARARFQRVFELWPDTDVAAYSAKLFIDSYNDEEDLVNYRKWAMAFSTMLLGNGADNALAAEEFRDLGKRAAYTQAYDIAQLAQELRRQGDMAGYREQRLEAAQAFQAYMDEFPEVDENYRLAFYSVGQNYSEAGEVDKANDYFKEFVDRFPDDERAWPLTFRIASNYASILDLEQAVSYFERLVNNAGTDYADAPTALYNAAFLRIGMGDYAGAARGFERYVRTFPDSPDAEKVMFQAGAQWAEIGQREAQQFYKRYLQQFKGTNPDHMMEAYFQLAQIAEDSGARQREIERAWDDLSESYTQYAEQIGPRGSYYAAQAEFRKIEAEFAAFEVINYTRNDERNAELLIQEKPAQLAAFEQRCLGLVSTYKDFEYSSAALYMIGKAYIVYAQMLYDAPAPPGLDEESEMLYRELLDERRIPIEDKGRTRLMANLSKAEESKRWSEWQTRTLDLLSETFAGEFAPEKSEIRGTFESNYVPPARPVTVRPIGEEAEQ
jgi:TolA-binding protein